MTTKTVKIFHAKASFFRTSVCYRGTEDSKRRIVESFANHYSHVADVTINSPQVTEMQALNTAYHDSQNIEYPWPNNERVTAYGSVHRSTSVGDIMQFDDRTFIVAMIDFDEVTDLMVAT